MKNLIALITILFLTLCANAQKRKQSTITTTSTTTTSTLNNDTLNKRCGITFTDTSVNCQVYTLVNLKTELINNSTIISFDAPVITGKTATGFLLMADQCNGRPDCGWRNGIKVSQVTTNVSSPKIFINLGQTWLAGIEYTGIISISFSDNCSMYSQPFKFTAPKIY